MLCQLNNKSMHRRHIHGELLADSSAQQNGARRPKECLHCNSDFLPGIGTKKGQLEQCPSLSYV
jgi:hypothetical protein